MTESLFDILKKKQDEARDIREEQQEGLEEPTDMFPSAYRTAKQKQAQLELIRPDSFAKKYLDWYTGQYELLENLSEQGVVPQFKDRNLLGLYESGSSFLGKKLMSALMPFVSTFP